MRGIVRQVVCRLQRGIFLLALGFGCAPAAAVQDCEVNGESVNPANGHTTKGRTGLMRCRDRDTGVIAREQELRDGQFVGLVRHYQAGRLSREHSVNERGNRHGLAREFDAEGRLLREARYDNGSVDGLLRSFHPNGQLRRVSYHTTPGGERAAAEFNDRGQLADLRCADRPMLAPAVDDAKLCGFDAPSEIAFHRPNGEVGGRARVESGRRTRWEMLHANGQPSATERIDGDRRIEQRIDARGIKRWEAESRESSGAWLREREAEHAETGTLVRERRWSGRNLVSQTEFFLNGQPRRRLEYRDDAVGRLATITTYFDTGARSGVGDHRVNRGVETHPIGRHQRFHESGATAAETDFDDHGRPTRERVFDDKGRLIRDDEVFADGSRKAFAR